MIAKLDTALWFARRPSHWRHAVALVLRKALPDHDAPAPRAKARAWAADRAVPLAEALATLGVHGTLLPFNAAGLAEGTARAAGSSVQMGGAGDLDLLSNAVRLTGARRVVETGVAYGWSSLAILDAMDQTGGGRLASVDMPYVKRGNEPFVGIVVPDRLRAGWTLIREPDRNGIEKAIAALGGQIDLCHYDSDKSWWGRAYAFPRLWQALAPGGLFISDDIQDNMFFAEFAASKSLPFTVVASAGKFVGLIRKA